MNLLAIPTALAFLIILAALALITRDAWRDRRRARELQEPDPAWHPTGEWVE